MTTKELIETMDKQQFITAKKFLDEWTLEVTKEQLKPLLRFFMDKSYRVLMDLTAVDYLEPEIRTKVIYWLHNPDNLERVRLHLFVVRDEKIPSVTDLFEGANWYERELYDMFGIHFENHPDLKRILMPDDWKGHPMQRDYPLTEVPVQFKHGVMPKVPSAIIPNDKLKVIHHG
ncbi:MAG TPA: NADH-quinone oxidoreductase subunit C [Parachlamydiaceae bacterium]|nr:NADH-quinone oxidoreductase subunit C [Parachlamydiaceae bacterium]